MDGTDRETAIVPSEPQNEAPVPKKRSRNATTFGNPSVDPERNREHIDFLLSTAFKGGGLDNPHSHDPDVLRAKFYDYIYACRETNHMPGNMAAYNAMGITKSLVEQWSNGKSGTKEQRAFVAELKAFMSAVRETYTQSGDLNVVWAIFSAKNYDGMKDQPNTDAPEVDLYRDAADPAALAEKYKNLPD